MKVLDGVIKESDEQAETWYLLAFSLFKLEKFLNARECIKNVELLIEKQKITDDSELIEGTKELKEGIQAKLENMEAKEAKDEEMIQDGEEGYETVSEEDISDE